MSTKGQSGTSSPPGFWAEGFISVFQGFSRECAVGKFIKRAEGGEGIELAEAALGCEQLVPKLEVGRPCYFERRDGLSIDSGDAAADEALIAIAGEEDSGEGVADRAELQPLAGNGLLEPKSFEPGGAARGHGGGDPLADAAGDLRDAALGQTIRGGDLDLGQATVGEVVIDAEITYGRQLTTAWTTWHSGSSRMGLMFDRGLSNVVF
jgi:hypothetical protein